MGTTNSKNNKQHKIEHQRFQNAKIIGDDQIEILVRTTLDDYNTWRSNLKKISFTNKQNILFPLNHSFHEEGWCSQNTGFAKITFDNYSFIFQQELQNRIELNKHLSQQQMWYLLYTLVSTAKDFSFINKKIGDVRPHNIFINSAGQIKLAVCFSYPNEPNNLQKTMIEKQITYLSPEQLQICKNNKIQNLINAIVAESFSIGLTMLHAGLLQNLSSLYDISKFQINRKLYAQKIQSWMDLQFIDENNNKTSYSPALKQIIRNLCILDQNTREKSTQVFKLLQQHKDAILNIQPFEIKYGKRRQSIKQHVPPQNGSNPLQKSLGFPVYQYTEAARQFPSTQTPISINPNYDWSTRTFTQVPLNRNPPIDYNVQFFDKYANSANSPQKNNNINLKMTNTIISHGQSIETKPTNYDHSTISKNAVITIKPFVSIDQQTTQQSNIYRNQNFGPLQRHIDKRVQSNDFIQIGYQENQNLLTNKYVSSVPVNRNFSSDFLKKIEEQIQKSKAMFPS